MTTQSVKLLYTQSCDESYYEETAAVRKYWIYLHTKNITLKYNVILLIVILFKTQSTPRESISESILLLYTYMHIFLHIYIYLYTYLTCNLMTYLVEFPNSLHQKSKFSLLTFTMKIMADYDSFWHLRPSYICPETSQNSIHARLADRQVKKLRLSIT